MLHIEGELPRSATRSVAILYAAVGNGRMPVTSERRGASGNLVARGTGPRVPTRAGTGGLVVVRGFEVAVALDPSERSIAGAVAGADR